MLYARLTRICLVLGSVLPTAGFAPGCFPDPPPCVGDNPCDEDADSELDDTNDSEAADSETGDGDDDALEVEALSDGTDVDAPDAETSDIETTQVEIDISNDAETATDIDTTGEVDVAPDVQPDTQVVPDTEPPPDTSPPLDTQPEVETLAEVDTTPDTEPEIEVETGPEIVVLDCNDLPCTTENRECIEGTGAVDAVCGGCLLGYTLVGGNCLAATPPPTGVTASTARASDVEVSWNALANATGYHVYRCDLASCPGDTGWFVLTSTPVTETSYIDDTAAIPGLPTAPANVSATRTSASQVTLTWAAVTVAAAPTYRYRVVALGAAGASPGSQAAQGKVADRPVSSYDITIDGGGWTSTGGLAVQYNDLQAPAPTVSAATATATQGTFEQYVRLAATGGSATQGAERQYEVRATTATTSGPGGSASGWRVAGLVTLQWERSTGTSPDGFSPIAGATATTYDDTTAPADGSTRWYRVVASATGAISQPGPAVAGSRLNPTSLVPTGVTASVDRASDVEIRWSPVANATGYYVSRCDVANCTSGGAWNALNGVALTSASYLDATVAVPALPPAPGSVVAGGEPDQVTLTWGAVVAPSAKRYSYRVTAVVSGTQGAPSESAAGGIAERPLTGYEVRIDAGAWSSVGTGVFLYQDTQAPAPTLSAVTATASQSTYAEYVRLSSSGGAATPGALRSLDVRATTDSGAGPAASASARRTAGTPTYQWERSSGTTASGFAPINGANAASYDDAGAPSDGSLRFYRLVVSATGATPVTSTAVSGTRLGPPTAAPTVSASDDLDDMVKVTWQAVGGATSYHVYRNGTKLTSGSGVTTTSYEDRTLTAAGSWLAPTSLTATTNNTNQVDLAWVAPTRPLGPTASYTVRAVNAAGEGPASTADNGQRAALALLGYEVEVAPTGLGSSWMPTGSTNVAYTHIDPPKGSISGGTMTTTQGTKRAGVTLTTAGGSVTAAVNVAYRVRGILPANATTPSSNSTNGNRAVGTLSRAWQRSPGTANSGFSDLGTSALTYDDTSAPSNGDHRWYQVVLSAPGCNSSTLTALEGWRLAFVAVDGGGSIACALSAEKEIWCWGDGQSIAPIPKPLGVAGFTALSVGEAHTCAISNQGELWCWGANDYGQLGDGSGAYQAFPVKAVGLLGTIISVGAGLSHTCGVTSSNAVQCWGRNILGGLGNNSTIDSTTPVTVRTSISNLTGVLDVSAGTFHNCARRSSDVYCWGGNSNGELGNGSQVNSSVAVQVLTLTSVAELALGAIHSCARLTNETVRCWGAGVFGQLGNNSTALQSSPVAVLNVAGATRIAGGGSSMCARESTGVVRCWGRNTFGALGNGTATDSSTPVVASSVGATTIGAGAAFVCAVVNGGLKCWGQNNANQCGDGSTTNRTTAVDVILP